MPSFFRAFSNSNVNEKKDRPTSQRALPQSPTAQRPTWQDAWLRTEVAPEEVQELLHVCTQEMKSRALDTPFLLLPFRPHAEPNAARTFIRSYFRSGQDLSVRHMQERFYELRLLDPIILCSIMKWCWSRLKGGVVTWSTYELFRTGEKESRMAKSAFDTFIPLSVTSEARKKIIFSFFDLLAAIAANSKRNGLGGRKLSRLAGWWAFEQVQEGQGFHSGYRSWASAADATSHLFFAYLRARAPDPSSTTTSISQLSRSLQALVSQTQYPPQTPVVLQSDASHLVIAVENFSTSPLALLQRARKLRPRSRDAALEELSRHEDPSLALTEECRRVLNAISGVTQVVQQTSDKNTPSWTQFEDLGFATMLDGNTGSVTTDKNVPRESTSSSRPTTASAQREPVRQAGASSWNDFMQSGFSSEYDTNNTSTVLTPPDKILPPLNASLVPTTPVQQANGIVPGEIQSMDRIRVEETFWWVWITSLSGEEPPARQAVFDKCAILEIQTSTGRWLVIEEQVKMKQTYTPERPVLLTPRKSRFSFTKRTRSTQSVEDMRPTSSPLANGRLPSSKVIEISGEQRARVHAAAAALVHGQNERAATGVLTRQATSRSDDNLHRSSLSSTTALGANFQSDSATAMQWDRKFEKESTRQKYLEDPNAGRGSANQVSAEPMGASTADPQTVPTTGRERNLPTPPVSGQSTPALMQHNITSITDLPPTLPIISAFDGPEALTPRLTYQGSDENNFFGQSTHTERGPTLAVNTIGAGTSQEDSSIVQGKYAADKKESAVNSPLDRVAQLEKSKTGSIKGLRSMFKRKQSEDAPPSPPKSEELPVFDQRSIHLPQPNGQRNATGVSSTSETVPPHQTSPSRRTSLHSRASLRPQRSSQAPVPTAPQPQPRPAMTTQGSSSAMMAAQAAMNAMYKRPDSQVRGESSHTPGSSRASISRTPSLRRRDTATGEPTSTAEQETSDIRFRKPVSTARNEPRLLNVAVPPATVRRESSGPGPTQAKASFKPMPTAVAGAVLKNAMSANSMNKRYSTPTLAPANNTSHSEPFDKSVIGNRGASPPSQTTLPATESQQSFKTRAAAMMYPNPLTSDPVNQRQPEPNRLGAISGLDGTADSTSDYSFDLARKTSLRQPSSLAAQPEQTPAFQGAFAASRHAVIPGRYEGHVDDSHVRNTSAGNVSIGDGDFTPEHAVEVRVARIKARVAELTGTTATYANQAAGVR